MPPKIVICFSAHGCMGTELRFKWIGVATNPHRKPGSDVTYYSIQPLVKGSIENRSVHLPFEEAYQIQHLGFNLYIHYV